VVPTVRKEDQEKEGGGGRSINTQTESLTLKDAYSLLLKEVEIATLQSISLDTYQNIAIVLESLRGQRYEGVEEKIRDRMVDMICNSAEILLETRYRKLLEQQQQAGGSALHSTINAGVDYSKLTEEEKYILDGQKESDKRRMAVLAATLRGRPKVLESISARIRSKQVVVRFIKPMEQFIGTNMTKYGPFLQEDVAVIPFENARSLIENGEAVEIQIT
jgi:DNA replication factor GINS